MTCPLSPQLGSPVSQHLASSAIAAHNALSAQAKYLTANSWKEAWDQTIRDMLSNHSTSFLLCGWPEKQERGFPAPDSLTSSLLVVTAASARQTSNSTRGGQKLYLWGFLVSELSELSEFLDICWHQENSRVLRICSSTKVRGRVNLVKILLRSYPNRRKMA